MKGPSLRNCCSHQYYYRLGRGAIGEIREGISPAFGDFWNGHHGASIVNPSSKNLTKAARPRRDERRKSAAKGVSKQAKNTGTSYETLNVKGKIGSARTLPTKQVRAAAFNPKVKTKPASKRAATGKQILVDAGSPGETPGKVGRPAVLTAGLVVQIAEKIGKGMPEKYACALFGISLDAWNKAKQRNDDVLEVVDYQKAVFLDAALDRIAAGCDNAVHLRWILMTRHKEHFNTAEVQITNNNTNQTFVLSPQDETLLQQHARQMFVKGN